MEDRTTPQVAISQLAHAVRAALAVAVLAGSGSAFAQSAPETQQSTTSLDTVSVLGSRNQPRSEAESSVPIDIIGV